MVYRYLNEQFALQALQTNELKVGRLGELNDPADCLPTLSGAPAQPNDEASEAFEKRYFSEIYNDIGIICFSSVVSDPVIWSHYADAHRGMALGFDFHESGAKLFGVTYDERRVSLDYEETEKIRNENDAETKYFASVITTGFTRKALSWEYEREYRLFMNLHHCRMKGPHYFIAGMRPDRVVLGLKSRITEADVFRSINHPGLKNGVTRAKMDREKHSLVVDFNARQ